MGYHDTSSCGGELNARGEIDALKLCHMTLVREEIDRKEERGLRMNRSCRSLLWCGLLRRRLLLGSSFLCCGGLLWCGLFCGLWCGWSLGLGDAAGLCLAEDARYLVLDGGGWSGGLAGFAGIGLGLSSSGLLRSSLCGCGLLRGGLLGGGGLGLLEEVSVRSSGG